MGKDLIGSCGRILHPTPGDVIHFLEMLCFEQAGTLPCVWISTGLLRARRGAYRAGLA